MQEITSLDSLLKIVDSKEAIALLFYMPSCSGCTVMKEIMLEAMPDYPTIKFCKVDALKYEDIADEYDIQSAPNILLFKAGVIVSKTTSAIPLPKLKALLKEVR